MSCSVSNVEELERELQFLAGVEHAFALQYLYAAYSLRLDHGGSSLRGELESIEELLRGIAREEMGHFATVQNLRILIGRRPSFVELELGPATAFQLEPLSTASARRYLAAERGELADGRVLASYQEVLRFLKSSQGHDVLDRALHGRQFTYDDWGFQARPSRRVRVEQFSEDPALARRDVIDALERILEQGGGRPGE